MGLYYRGTCLRTAMMLVGPYCHPLHVVISLFLSVVDDVDNARGRRTAHGERTKAARRRTMARPRTERTGAVEDAAV